MQLQSALLRQECIVVEAEVVASYFSVHVEILKVSGSLWLPVIYQGRKKVPASYEGMRGARACVGDHPTAHSRFHECPIVSIQYSNGGCAK